ncbi:nucleotide-binding universal stress UspA family protein [Leifsonia sp. EB41]|uniref:universal stress protein n=1 Tax=Leifsonia sp. EB41 TaxID=3156260 RepID=UPI0035119A53
MAETIMVGVDGKAEHRAALEWAVRRAVRDGSRLELVFVLQHSWGDDADGPSDLLVLAAKSLLGTEREAALRIAEDASARVPALTGPEPAPRRHSGLEVGTRYLYGHVGAELTAASRGADLLVVGARSRSQRDRGFAGSLHLRVASTAACSVAVVPHGWARSGAGVVAGVDGKPPSETAVAFAADEAAALGEGLRLVCVGYTANPLLAGLVPEVSLDDRRQRIVDAAAESARERRPGIDVRADVIEAAPARGLVEAAEGSRMLIVGTRDRHGAKRVMLGSVGHDVLLNVRVPVVIARTRHEAE